MFLGHFGIAFASKRILPTHSLGTLMAAASAPQLIWLALLLTGRRRVVIHQTIDIIRTPLGALHYPISETLPAVVALPFAAAILTWLITRQRAPSVLLGGLVATHWLVDAILQRRSILATVAVEFLIFVGGVILYARSTQPTTLSRRDWALASLVAGQLLISIRNALFPVIPHPNFSIQTLEIAALITNLTIIPVALLIDRRRTAILIP